MAVVSCVFQSHQKLPVRVPMVRLVQTENRVKVTTVMFN